VFCTIIPDRALSARSFLYGTWDIGLNVDIG
jgi:hypothetical protein